MPRIISCTVETTKQAENILSQLRTENFLNNNISVLFPDKAETKQWVQEKHTKAPEGAVTGAGTGGIIGGILGWLIGIGSLAIPGVGPFIAAGPIMAALSGTAIGAAVGGVTGALVGLGIPEFEAKILEMKLKEGHILVAVNVLSNEQETSAKKIFKSNKALNISATQEESSLKMNNSQDRYDNLSIPL